MCVRSLYDIEKTLKDETHRTEIKAFLKIWTKQWLEKWRERVTICQKKPHFSLSHIKVKKKAEKMWRAKVDVFQDVDTLGVAIDSEMTFNKLINWGLKQDVMQAKASSNDDITRAEHLKEYFGEYKAVQITPLMVDNYRIKMTKTKSAKTGKFYSGSTINKMVSLGRRIYYLGMDAGHYGGKSTGEYRANAGVGLATLPLDGFVSLQAGYLPGIVTTWPLKFSGHSLFLNAGAAEVNEETWPDHGIDVEILDEEGYAIPEFSRHDCDTLRETGTYLQVFWNGNSDLSLLLGKPVKLRFYLQFAGLYSIQFRNA